MGKTLGIVFIAIGVGILFLAGAWALSNTGLEGSAKVLVLAFGFVIAAPLIGVGVVSLAKGMKDAGEEGVIAKQRKLLSLVMTQGKINLPDAALELKSTRNEVKQLVYDLIGKQLFSGYVDWDAGMLYSEEASKLKTGKCPKCGGELTLAGKGLVKCAYCGTEVFSSQ